MLRFLDAILILVVLINLIKGAELLLRPHQEKWLKSKLESLVLWLDYTRPIEWYMRPENIRAAYLLSRSMLFFISSFLMLKKYNYSNHGTFLIVLNSITLTLILNMLRFGYDLRSEADKTKFRTQYGKQEMKLREWMWKNPTILNYLVRQIILSIAGVTAIFALLAFIPIILIIWIRVKNSSFESIRFLLLTTLILAVVYRKKLFLLILPLGNLGILATFNVAITLLIIVSEITLRILRGFVWRVVEYNKGPVAAFTLVITVLLGIAEAYLRFLHK